MLIIRNIAFSFLFFLCGLFAFAQENTPAPLSVSINPLKTVNANTCSYGLGAHVILGFPNSPSTVHIETSVVGGTPGYTYLWRGSLPDGLSNIYVANPEFNPMRASYPHPSCATYTYTVTVTDAAKKTASAVVTIDVVNLQTDGCGNGKVMVCHKNKIGQAQDVCTSANNIPAHVIDNADSPVDGHEYCCLGSCGNKCTAPKKVAANDLMDEELNSGPILENFPEPFRTSTTVRFVLPDTGPATLEVYDLRGKLIKSLFKEVAQSNREYKILFEPSSDLQQGIYIYKLITPEQTLQGKMILMGK